MAETRTLEEVFTAVTFGPTDRYELDGTLDGRRELVQPYA